MLCQKHMQCARGDGTEVPTQWMILNLSLRIYKSSSANTESKALRLTVMDHVCIALPLHQTHLQSLTIILKINM